LIPSIYYIGSNCVLCPRFAIINIKILNSGGAKEVRSLTCYNSANSWLAQYGILQYGFPRKQTLRPAAARTPKHGNRHVSKHFHLFGPSMTVREWSTNIIFEKSQPLLLVVTYHSVYSSCKLVYDFNCIFSFIVKTDGSPITVNRGVLLFAFLLLLRYFQIKLICHI